MFEKEENGKSQDGFYRHEETGQVVKLENDPDLGTPLTNAYIRAGFKFIGTEPPEVVSEESGYTTYTDVKGVTRYRYNGKLISKDEYESHQ